MQELEIKIYGRVQGVNFRRNVEKIALQLHLTGYVENCADGSVYIIAQGKQESQKELLTWAQKGSFPARVTGMHFDWKDAAKTYKTFKIKKDKSFFKDQAKSFLNLGREVGKEILNFDDVNVPNHVAIIPDGNRRWAREQGWHAWIGHRRAAEFERVMKLFQECKDMGVQYLSFWAFSTENWKRDPQEIEELFDILRESEKKFKPHFIKERIRFRHLGRRDRLPRDIVEILENLEKETADFDKLNFQLLIDYNGRDDISRAVQKMIADKVKVEDVSEELISKYLDTNSSIPDPDLIIRTSGERRTSGIMAYQAAYSELYFTNVYFPDFDAEHFRLAVLDYSARTRRFGGTVQDDLKHIKRKLIDPELAKLEKVKNFLQPEQSEQFKENIVVHPANQ